MVSPDIDDLPNYSPLLVVTGLQILLQAQIVNHKISSADVSTAGSKTTGLDDDCLIQVVEEIESQMKDNYGFIEDDIADEAEFEEDVTFFCS